KKVHFRILTDIDNFVRSIGFIADKYTFSPVRGGSGNIEYLVKLRKAVGEPVTQDFKELINSSFSKL
ncbi:MAG: TlyA family RNA methyltransferase, partial [Ruminococcus sp.]|nr:TlyA family RNA methyltransferase [Ruminococcus sp.]